ncbi:MAG TPA: MarR family transcriptional regulator [Marmoricola sp.]|jgi:DNA-binding transcriptional ArsR family regulator|nr:MarR family transcriptional regulator [Marmoricola sp.]
MEPTSRREPGAAVSQFVEDFGLALSQLGFPRMPARVFALAIATPEESLTARELAERLGVSPAAISGAVRYLAQLNLIRRSRTPGERVDRYGLGDEVWSPVFEAEIAAYAPLRALCTRALDDDGLEGSGRNRVAETRDFLDFMTTEMAGIMQRWHARRG